jgi:hypothetical protein
MSTSDETEDVYTTPVATKKSYNMSPRTLVNCSTLLKQQVRNLREQKSRERERRFVRSVNVQREVWVPVTARTLDTHWAVDLKALLDSGATGLFIDKKFVTMNDVTTRKLEKPIAVYNVDGTPNKVGTIEEEVTLMLSYKGHKERAVFEVCDLGKTHMILGLPWLKKHNPDIDWVTGKINMTRCPHECNVFIRAATKERKIRRLREKHAFSPTVEEVGEDDDDEDDDEEDERRTVAVMMRDESKDWEEVNQCVGRLVTKEDDVRKKLVDEKGDVFFVGKIERPASWGMSNLNPHEYGKELKELVPEEFH